MKILIIITALLSLTSCAPLVIGGIAGVAVYQHECTRWVNGPYGPHKVWVCRGRRGYR